MLSLQHFILCELSSQQAKPLKYRIQIRAGKVASKAGSPPSLKVAHAICSFTVLDTFWVVHWFMIHPTAR